MSRVNFYSTDKWKMYISNESIEDQLDAINPSLIINCIAIASHEKCENNPKEAYTINSELPLKLGVWCKRNKKRLIHFSTDAVFSGQTNTPPFHEHTKAVAIGTYAQSKLYAENLLSEECPNESLIIRTNFFGWHPTGKGILDFFYANLVKGNEVNGFYDYIVSSIYIVDLVKIVLDLNCLNTSGIYHVCSRDSLSKYQFALKVAQEFQFDKSLIQRTSIESAKTMSTRGKNISLSPDKAEKHLKYVFPLTAEGISRAPSDRLYWKSLLKSSCDH